MKQQSHFRREKFAALLLALSFVFAACDQPADIDAPTLSPQLSSSPVTLVFHVNRADNNAPVPGATVSVYVDGVSQPVWVTTGNTGIAEFSIADGSNVGYLARLLPKEWTNFADMVIPPLDPGAFTPPAFDDLGAVTCSSSGPVSYSASDLVNCVNNRYVTINGVTHVYLQLPVVGNRSVNVVGPNGNSLANSHAYLIEQLPAPFPWQNVPQGGKAGFLAFFNSSGGPVNVPGGPGVIEVYGSFNGFDVAGTTPVNGGTTADVETSPVICVNPAQTGLQYSFTKGVTNAQFSFLDARWAYAARRGTTEALNKDMTISVAVVLFEQHGGPHTVEFRQRHHASGTDNASVQVQCTDGVCDVANAVFKTPGANNPVQPYLYQPKPGKLFWVVKNLNPSAESEWSARAFGNGNLDQIPVASKNNATSAFFLFARGFTFCDPDFSFDGVWGCDV